MNRLQQNTTIQKSTPYPLERKKRAITHHDIYTSLEHYGYPLISHIPLKKGGVLPIENLILEILDKTTQIREIEGIPLILSKNCFFPGLLSTNAKKRNLINKTGYICELSLDIFNEEGIEYNREELKVVSDELHPYKTEGDVPLINGLPKELIEKFRQKDHLEKKWGVIGCFDYLSSRNLLKKR